MNLLYVGAFVWKKKLEPIQFKFSIWVASKFLFFISH